MKDKDLSYELVEGQPQYIDISGTYGDGWEIVLKLTAETSGGQADGRCDSHEQ